MNRPALFVLIALNALFAFVLASEWFAESEKTHAMQHESKKLETQDEDLPSLDLEAKSEDEYSDLVERPLFIEGRKPVAEPEPETVPVAAVKKVEAFVWDVTGIFATPKGVTAFFSRINGKVEKDNYRKLQLGDDIDGWKLSDIAPDKVTLTQMGETKNLPLRKAKPKNMAPASSVPVVANSNNRQQIRQGIPQLRIPAQAEKMPETVQPIEPPADETDATAQQ
jgi:hypothetical protein